MMRVPFLIFFLALWVAVATGLWATNVQITLTDTIRRLEASVAAEGKSAEALKGYEEEIKGVYKRLNARNQECEDRAAEWLKLLREERAKTAKLENR